MDRLVAQLVRLWDIAQRRGDRLTERLLAVRIDALLGTDAEDTVVNTLVLIGR